VTLWSLLGDARVSRADRARVYERLAALVPPPERATRARLLAGDKTALLWWRLDLEDRWAEASGDDAGAWLPDEWDAWNGADASAATWDAGPATDAADTWSADPAGNAGETWSAGPAGNAGETWGGNAPDARP
jgi:hypothetical protein